MAKFIEPDISITWLCDLNLSDLKKSGINAIFIDADNTISPWRVSKPTEDFNDFLKAAQENDISIILFSNAKGDRGKIYAKDLGIDCVANANKPLPNKLLKGMKERNLSKDEVLVLGDQLFTDMACGKLAGVKTVLIAPLVNHEYILTRILRFFERIYGLKVKYRVDYKK